MTGPIGACHRAFYAGTAVHVCRRTHQVDQTRYSRACDQTERLKTERIEKGVLAAPLTGFTFCGIQ
jgi:hypothetical protein